MYKKNKKLREKKQLSLTWGIEERLMEGFVRT